jgi:hypothetical protein
MNAARAATNGNGHGPPKDMAPGELWTKLQEMPRPSVVVDFPRKGPDGEPVGRVAMQVLSQEEQMICAAAAERFTKEKLREGQKGEFGYETLYGNELVVQVLSRACRQEDDVTRAAFPSSTLMRQRFTADELGILFEQYLSVQLRLGPIVSKLQEHELDAWVDMLVEGGLAASPFDFLSSDMKKVLAHSMASQIAELRKAKSSAGSPPDDTSESGSSDSNPQDSADSSSNDATGSSTDLSSGKPNHLPTAPTVHPFGGGDDAIAVGVDLDEV